MPVRWRDSECTCWHAIDGMVECHVIRQSGDDGFLARRAVADMSVDDTRRANGTIRGTANASNLMCSQLT